MNHRLRCARLSFAASGIFLGLACAPMEGAEDLGSSSGAGAPTPIGSSSSSGDGGTPGPGADAGGRPPDAGAPVEDPDFLVKQDAVFVDGAAQRIVVMEPRRPASAKLPIVVAYHGDRGSAEAFRQEWALHRVSGQAAVVVYADDSANTAAWGGAAMHVDHPLAAGFGKIVQRMTQVYDGDASKVFVAGLSSGGIFAGLLACKYSGSTTMSLRAAVVMSGSGPNPAQVSETWPTGFPKCAGQKPITTLVIHGRADQTAGVAFEQGQWAADYATYVNRVAGQPPFAGPQENFGNDATSTPFSGFAPQCRKYDDSPPANPVVFCAVDGLGHSLWPESASTAWQFANHVAP